jgi:signal transduction histidine kinase
MRKNVKAFLAIAAVLLAANCESKSSQPSASDIANAWLDINTKLAPPDMTETFFSDGIALQIEEFSDSLNRFINSPVGYLYRMRRREDMRSLQEISVAINRLKAALHNGNAREVFSSTLEIDRAVSILQRVDAELSVTSQLSSFLLFFFLSLMIIAITLILTALQNRLGKEMVQHQQSLSFSRGSILAQEHERSRIARELHDTVAQDLLRLSLQTEIIKKDAVSEKQSRLCATVAEGQTELLNRIRNICNDLIPPDFQPSGINYKEHPVPRLPDALRTLCGAFEKRTGVECNIMIHDGADFSFLDVDMQLHCFRIVQECLANVEKHAKAGEVSVLVRSNAEGELLLFVTDNGKGFEGTDKNFFRMMRAKGHFGLWNMQERAASINGVLSINSEAGEGNSKRLNYPPPPPPQYYFRRGRVNHDFHSPHRRSPHVDQRYQRMAGSYRTLYHRGYCGQSCGSPRAHERT